MKKKNIKYQDFAISLTAKDVTHGASHIQRKNEIKLM